MRGKGLLRTFLAGLMVLGVAVTANAEMVDKVIVVVNDEVVTQREFDRLFEPMKAQFEARFKGDELQGRLEAAQNGLIEQLINSKLAISLAKKQELEIDDAELQKRLDMIKGYYPSEQDFLQALNDKGTNLTEFEKEMRDQMLAQKLVEKEVSSKIDITPAETRDLYEKNKESLISPETAKVKGIMVRKRKMTDDAEGKEKINEIMKKLEKGADFGEIALKESEGPFAKESGNMGFVPKGQTLPEIDKAIFDAEPGEMTAIIETPVGYHIFLVEEKQESRPLSFDEVSEFLRNQIYARKFEAELKEWLEKQRKDAYISYK